MAAGQRSSGREAPGDAEHRGQGDAGTRREFSEYTKLSGAGCIPVGDGCGDARLRDHEELPSEEKYSLVDQVRRSSRSICANLAEACRKQRYEAHFVSKLSDAESEAEESRVWLEFAYKCCYISPKQFEELDDTYDKIVAQLVKMLSQPSKWRIR
jgi:four helix bundle protein